ncbi:MAG: HAD-IC family P-type ATPase, partial [Proteobacteria bacterium]|nr:HAD-IC family P-type ATPase [Pseudomonadota bacterium]
DEAGTLDLLCSDKTGTLTSHALTVTSVHAGAGSSEREVLAWAALASADGGLDPVDLAIHAAAPPTPPAVPGPLLRFEPFDPARKRAQAVFAAADGGAQWHVLKGALAQIATLVVVPAEALALSTQLESQGQRVLGVAAGPPDRLAWIGLIALSDPPRPDAQALIGELATLGVSTVMVTGDAAGTAVAAARAVGLEGKVWTAQVPPERLMPADYAVFAGVYPDDKLRIVQAFQRGGCTVGMCGDGVNDAPALRQAQLGIAVSNATDAAKAAAGMVLTAPGLHGIVEAVRVGRLAYQRILTYTLRSVTAKVTQMTFLTAGLWLTGHAILTPMLMALVVISGDFLAMSATTDRVRPSPRPNAWRVGAISGVAALLGLGNLVFCVGVLLVGERLLGLSIGHGLRTLAALALVFSTQAAFYVVRERRRLWSSRPGVWVVLSTVVDVTVITLLAGLGILMHPLPWSLILGVLLAALLLSLVLDQLKVALLRRVTI